MQTIHKFAIQNIRHQSFRSLLFFFLVFLASTVLFGTGILTENLQIGVRQAQSRIDADLIVVPSEYGDNAKEALFEGNACTILFQKNPAEALKKIEGIKQLSQQLFLETLKMPCCSAAGVQLIAIDIHSDFAVGKWLKNKGIETLRADEIIAGCACGLHVNDKINFYNREFTVAAVLEETGLGYDESAFLSFEAAELITSDPQYDALFGGKTGLSSMILAEIEDGCQVQEVRQKINERLVDYGICAYETTQLTEKLIRQMNYFKLMGNLANAFVLLLAAVALFALITITFYQRKNRVGSLLSVGVPRNKIIQIFLLEYLYLMLLGVIAAIVLVSIFVFPLHNIIKQSIDLPYCFVGFKKMAWIGFRTVVVNGLVLFLGASLSFLQIIKLEPAILVEEQI